MEEIKIEQECCICYLETKNKTVCMHDVCIDCEKKINKCPICRMDLIKNINVDSYGRIWKPIPNYENYEISNHGNVRAKNAGLRLEISYDMKGRRYVILNKNGIKKKFALHDLIEDAFP
jgi:hypothetical protein